MVGSDRSKIQDHDGETVILPQGQYARHFGLPIRDSALLFAYGLHALGKHEKRLVNASRLNHTVLVVFCPSVVFRAGQINCRGTANEGRFFRCLRELDTEHSMRPGRMSI